MVRQFSGNLTEKECITREILQGHSQPVSSGVLTSGANWALTGSFDGSAILWALFPPSKLFESSASVVATENDSETDAGKLRSDWAAEEAENIDRSARSQMSVSVRSNSLSKGLFMSSIMKRPCLSSHRVFVDTFGLEAKSSFLRNERGKSVLSKREFSNEICVLSPHCLISKFRLIFSDILTSDNSP